MCAHLSHTRPHAGPISKRANTARQHFVGGTFWLMSLKVYRFKDVYDLCRQLPYLCPTRRHPPYTGHERADKPLRQNTNYREPACYKIFTCRTQYEDWTELRTQRNPPPPPCIGVTEAQPTQQQAVSEAHVLRSRLHYSRKLRSPMSTRMSVRLTSADPHATRFDLPMLVVTLICTHMLLLIFISQVWLSHVFKHACAKSRRRFVAPAVRATTATVCLSAMQSYMTLDVTAAVRSCDAVSASPVH